MTTDTSCTSCAFLAVHKWQPSSAFRSLFLTFSLDSLAFPMQRVYSFPCGLAWGDEAWMDTMSVWVGKGGRAACVTLHALKQSISRATNQPISWKLCIWSSVRSQVSYKSHSWGWVVPHEMIHQFLPCLLNPMAERLPVVQQLTVSHHCLEGGKMRLK